MVKPEQQRSRYVGGVEGAPPVPPPGGYRGARRVPVAGPTLAPMEAAQAAITAEKAEKPRSVLGWVALGVTIAFALFLLLTLTFGGTNALYSVSMITIQLVVLAVIIAAMVTHSGRRLGSIALIIALLLNVGTVGALSAIRTSASGTYDDSKTPEQRHAEGFPGVKGYESSVPLNQDSLEQVDANAEAAMAEIRERLTDEFGFTWIPVGEVDHRPERNGYGGESMLVQYTSRTWATVEPIQDDELKRDVMDVIAEVVSDHDLWGFGPLNEPNYGVDDSLLAQLYGSADPRTQHTWEWYADDFPGPMRFYATIDDLSNDTIGDFTASRHAQSARTGEPLEGLQLMVIAPRVLSEADRDAYVEKLDEYPGY